MDIPAKVVAAGADHGGGGSSGSARSRFPHTPEPWLDLSIEIDAHSYPLFDLPATALAAWHDENREGGVRATVPE
jgi:cobalamin biosynthetic protein CobC